MQSKTWPFPVEPKPLITSVNLKKTPSVYCNPIDGYSNDLLAFEPTTLLVETFPCPLPIKDALGKSIKSKKDLLMTSTCSYTEIYLPRSISINATLNGKRIYFTRDEFLSWQLLRASAETLWHLALKTDVHLENLFPYDNEISEDEFYDLDTLFCAGPSSGLDSEKCINLILRLRKCVPTEFCNLFINSFYSLSTGFESFLETEIDRNVAQVSEKYLTWPCPLTVVSFGDFYVTIENETIQLIRGKSKVDRQYVRNYDERALK